MKATTKKEKQRWLKLYEKYEIDYYTNKVKERLKTLSRGDLFDYLDVSRNLYEFFLNFVSAHYFYCENVDEIVKILSEKHSFSQSERDSLKFYLLEIAYTRNEYPDTARLVFAQTKSELEAFLQEFIDSTVNSVDDETKKKFERIYKEKNIYSQAKKLREIIRETQIETYRDFYKKFNDADIYLALKHLQNKNFYVMLTSDMYSVDYFKNLHFFCETKYFNKKCFKCVFFASYPVKDRDGYLIGYPALEVWFFNQFKTLKQIERADDDLYFSFLKLMYLVFHEEDENVFNILKQHNIVFNELDVKDVIKF